jgi:hypothetical protein
VYHPTLGRFLQRDPIGYGADYISFYRYVENKPHFLVAPEGEFAAAVCIVSTTTACPPLGAIILGAIVIGGLLYTTYRLCKNPPTITLPTIDLPILRSNLEPKQHEPESKPKPRIPVGLPPYNVEDCPDDDEGTCAKEFPDLPICSSNYNYSSFEDACSSVGVDPNSKSIKIRPADTCPGGIHYNIPGRLTNDGKYYSVICCPCCQERDISNGIYEAYDTTECNRV